MWSGARGYVDRAVCHGERDSQIVPVERLDEPSRTLDPASPSRLRKSVSACFLGAIRVKILAVRPVNRCQDEGKEGQLKR